MIELVLKSAGEQAFAFELQSFPRERRLDWASLLRRVFQIDVMRCASCGARMRVVAFIQDGDVSRRILGHLGWPAQVPPARPARAPPTPLSGSDAELVFDSLDNEPWIEPAEPGKQPLRLRPRARPRLPVD